MQSLTILRNITYTNKSAPFPRLSKYHNAKAGRL